LFLHTHANTMQNDDTTALLAGVDIWGGVIRDKPCILCAVYTQRKARCAKCARACFCITAHATVRPRYTADRNTASRATPPLFSATLGAYCVPRFNMDRNTVLSHK
jgi:hypothetical protein